MVLYLLTALIPHYHAGIAVEHFTHSNTVLAAGPCGLPLDGVAEPLVASEDDVFAIDEDDLVALKHTGAEVATGLAGGVVGSDGGDVGELLALAIEEPPTFGVAAEPFLAHGAVFSQTIGMVGVTLKFTEGTLTVEEEGRLSCAEHVFDLKLEFRFVLLLFFETNKTLNEL